MPGGLIQLTTYGAQDLYLTGKPEISFFKSVYRRYTNYSTEMIEVAPTVENKNLQMSEDITFTFDIPRDGDLVKDVFFTFTLPAIYSNHTNTSGRNFRWIERIGEMIIKSVTLHIGGYQVDKLYGEWLHIWSELTLSGSQKDGYNKMIGNIVEIYDPESIPDISSYPTSTSTVPSIRSKKIFVPLKFFFNESYSTALPLIALQNIEKIRMEFNLRPFEELYTIVDTDTNRKRPLSSEANHNIGYYTSHDSSTSVNNYDINPNLEIEYIFLDRDERKRFALVEHQYLIHQNQYREETVTPLNSDLEYTFDLDITNPVTQLIWAVRRDDHEAANIWHNYTNWPTIKDPLRSYSGVDGNPYGNHLLSGQDTSSYLEQNLVTETTLRLGDAMDRFSTKSWEMFNLVNNYQHCTRIPGDGIYVYSFELSNNNPKQPSGSINFSRFDKIQLRVKLNKKCSQNIAGSTSAYNYRLMVFARNVNIFRIMGGMGAVEFNN